MAESIRKRGQGLRKKTTNRISISSDDGKGKSHSHKFGNVVDWSVLALIAALFLLVFIVLRQYSSLPEPNVSIEGTQFSTANARKSLEAIVELGIRHVGSEANEVHAKKLILQAIQNIKKKASPDVHIDVSVQKSSGSYYLDFLGGMTHIYHNVSNIVVQLQWNSSTDHAVMINAHYDSALGAPAASDDAVSCATMLEVMRCLSSPGQAPLDHSVIFLFNGAEETILQASHGFITQHPWAKKIKAFVNLEAAGAGGKEILFQTGPHNPWLANAYAKVAPYPHGSSVGQDLFQSGIIPSDTDFRIFRDYGNIPGIDMAFFVNGYVYHTEYDVPGIIPDGSIQRAGENVLAVVTELANSPFLVDPGKDKHGKVTYFDFLGLFMVVYPERLGTILNCATVIFSLLSMWLHCREEIWLVFQSSLVVLISQLVGIVLSLVTGVVVMLFGKSMSWFANPFVIVPLFYLPTLLGQVIVQWWWGRKNSSLTSSKLIFISLHSVLLLWTIALLITTYLRLSSSFVPMLWCLPLILFCFLPSFLLPSSFFPALLFASLVIPFSLGIHLNGALMDLFIPLTGRSGSALSPDVALALLCGVLAHIGAYPICYVVHASSKHLAKIGAIVLSAGWLIIVVLVIFGAVFPFKGPPQPKPKRIFFTHTQRVFYSSNGEVLQNDSRIYVTSMDYLGLNPLTDVMPLLENVVLDPCNGLYCDSPSYIPIFHVLTKLWYLPSTPPPAAVVPASIGLISTHYTSDNTKNFTFKAKFPAYRASMIVAPMKGQSMVSWSLENFIPPSTPDRGRLDGNSYYVFYARGTGEGDFTFWVEVQSDSISPPGLHLAVSAHYLDPPLSQSPELSQLLTTVPEWTTPIVWTIAYTQWTF